MRPGVAGILACAASLGCSEPSAPAPPPEAPPPAEPAPAPFAPPVCAAPSLAVGQWMRSTDEHGVATTLAVTGEEDGALWLEIDSSPGGADLRWLVVIDEATGSLRAIRRSAEGSAPIDVTARAWGFESLESYGIASTLGCRDAGSYQPVDRAPLLDHPGAIPRIETWTAGDSAFVAVVFRDPSLPLGGVVRVESFDGRALVSSVTFGRALPAQGASSP